MTAGLAGLLERQRIEQFLFREARLLDERRYLEWEALWDDHVVYWVPALGDDTDPNRDVSLIYDNRDRLHTRVQRLVSGVAPGQDPPPRTARVVSNIEIEPMDGGWRVHSSFHLAESRPGARVDWGGRTTHHLVERGGELRIAQKKVVLVNNDQELTAIDFAL